MKASAIRPIAETADSVTLARADYDALRELVEDAIDLADIEAVARRIQTGETGVLPASVVNRILDGEHPVAVLRELRGLTASELARRAGTSQSYVTEIETGVKTGGVETLRRLARVLDVPLETILPAPAE